MFVGVDGYARGWVAIALDDAGFASAGAFSSFDEVMRAYGAARAIGVDMPLGLTASEPREADAAARRFLKGQASSVFPAPVREVLRAKDYAEARAISLRVRGKSLSKQAFNLVRKMNEVDAHIADAHVFEVHPEVSFRQLGGARLPSKKTWGGLSRRLALLERAGVRIPPALGDADEAGTDDVVDAAIAAWSARRIARGEARTFPETPTQTDRGRLLAIWS